MSTGRILIVAIILIVILAILSERGFSLTSPRVADPDLTVPAELDPDQPINPQSDLVVDPPVARPPFSLEQPAGFVTGILHGLIAPITLILSMVTPAIRMYDPTNGGPFYDFGFLLGLILVVALISAPRYYGYWRRRYAD